MAKIRLVGAIILVDFDKTKKTQNPAIRQKIAVLVPDANIAQIDKIPTIQKKILCFCILLVIARIIKNTPAAAMCIPNIAASLNTDQ